MTNESKRSALIEERAIKVLLVDDQAMVGEAVRRMLADEEGIEFQFCSDPAQAIPTAEAFGPTVILQDLVMPDIDGLSLVKFYRANDSTRQTPIIVLSVKEDPKVKAEAFELGANDYLVKLPDRIELIARIRSHSNAYIHRLERDDAFAKLEEELADAADYVRSLLPAPLVEGAIRTDWRFIPSTQLGGDAFGYHWIDDSRFALYLLDVVGHGVGAALLSVSIMNALRSRSLPDVDFNDPGQVVKALNLTFPMDRQNGLIFTIWYGVYDAQTRELVYASGGHPPALLYADGADQPKRLESTGIIVGVMPRAAFAAERCSVSPGSRLYLFSDGVYEVFQPDGKLMTFDQFSGLLSETVRTGGNRIEAVHNRIAGLRGKDYFDDDYSMVEFIFE